MLPVSMLRYTNELERDRVFPKGEPGSVGGWPTRSQPSGSSVAEAGLVGVQVVEAIRSPLTVLRKVH